MNKYEAKNLEEVLAKASEAEGVAPEALKYVVLSETKGLFSKLSWPFLRCSMKERQGESV